ncbi:cob(I)yrinic acid a,c-diamide adenosyltransferase [Thiomonas intermedia]|uniref:cob(I)yrinic acid a,c-diamide adenosyltransferase n=1 Tax=Thiomonas intermedia TaxID=926 RepID=UPI0009A49E99|nr:cob(I)yrinic acid a,c-diamide adenosyltransferase [Thiomonas intermedia]
MGHRLTAISTRTGDAGTTGLGDGSRCLKSAARIQALGDVDELNSHLGLLRSQGLPEAIDTLLLQVQHDLFDLGGELSVPGMALLKPEQVAALDEALKTYNAQLPPLAEFILPGGTPTASQAHVCRTVARRAERAVVAVSNEVAQSGGAEAPLLLRAELLQYLNRLSDLLFVLARTLNRAGDAASTEVYWNHQRTPKG